ncbi:unnamed protein product [Rangifer tarandus platyrhynchus]|uniref:Uncharacterized protein n=1 Tax=Rangifer tarandus platyrhynchus TaxID=3082113 RepID=A0ABN8Z7N4_RANTA|nr:unnamed protein product [Rangifer tarandus platyrhynchus]
MHQQTTSPYRVLQGSPHKCDGAQPLHPPVFSPSGPSNLFSQLQPIKKKNVFPVYTSPPATPSRENSVSFSQVKWKNCWNIETTGRGGGGQQNKQKSQKS